MHRLLIFSLVAVQAVYGQDTCASVQLQARQDCGDASTTPASCVAKGCCWSVTNVPNEPNCFFRDEGTHHLDPQCSAIPELQRKDCGDPSTTPDGCVQKGCCWMVETSANLPNCFFKTGGPPVTDTPVTDGPRPTDDPNRTEGPIPTGPTQEPWIPTVNPGDNPQDDCGKVPNASRKDCSDASTLDPVSCIVKGCCWSVTTENGVPNCFHKP